MFHDNFDFDSIVIKYHEWVFLGGKFDEYFAKG
jgi:hypothetical protein